MAIDGWTGANGPALVSTGTGSAGALEVLGYTQDGVDIRHVKQWEPIFTDVFGPRVEHDRQDFGEVAIITCPFVAIDRTVWEKVISRGDRGALGQFNTPGRLASNDAFRLVVAAPQDAFFVRSYTKAHIDPDARWRNATKANPLTITFYAGVFASYTVTAGLNTVLYTKTAS
jgi:hypothetical protein